MKWVSAIWFFFLLAGSTHLYASNPIHFTQNKGQWPCDVDYRARIPGGHLQLNSQSFNYYFIDEQQVELLHLHGHQGLEEVPLSGAEGPMIDGRSINVTFNNARSVQGEPFGRKSFYYNYFLGSDPIHWKSRVSNFDGILYPSIYDGIDLKVYGMGTNLKYDIIVAPGADAGLVQISYTGAKSLRIYEGDLLIDGEFVKITEKKPIAYHVINGKKRWISCRYRLIDNELSFEFPDGYDSCYELVIDPLLIFSTYSGSTADNWGSTATPGENGMLYSSGVTNQIPGGAFPATPGAFQTSYGGLYDVGILKYDSAGGNLLYASFLGGSQSESPHSLVMAANRDLIVLGTTSSSNFPTSGNAFDRTFGGGTNETHVVNYAFGSDIFIARISSDGSQLKASTFVGGTANDGLNPTSSVLSVNYGDQLRGDIIVDSDDNILFSSVTSSNNFPAINSFSTTYLGGATDAVLVKMNSNLSQIIWSAYMGGSETDASHTLKIDDSGIIFIGGGTRSVDLPMTSGSYQPTSGGGVDGWIAKVKPDGTEIIACTYTGTALFNQVYFIDLNSNNEVYAYGQTVGNGFPVTPGVYSNPNSGQFLQKFSNDLKTLHFSTVFGSGRGIPDISPTAFLVNDCNNIYMTGWGGVVNQNTFHWNNNTIGMPVSGDAFQQTTSGSDFYFIVLTDDATQFLYGTYMGGNSSRTHVDGGTSRFDKSGVVYHAVCSGCAAYNATGSPTSDFPTTQGAWSKTNNSGNCNNAAFKFDLSSLRARIMTNSFLLDQPGLDQVCLPDSMAFQNISTGGEIYNWDFGDGTKEAKTDTAFILHYFAEPGLYRVKLTAIDAGTCVGKDSTFVDVKVSAPTGFAGPDRTICYGDLVQLEAGGGVTYEWISKEKDSVSNFSAQPVVSPDDTVSYFVKITDGNGCVVNDTVSVSVIPRVDLKFDYERMDGCNARPILKVTNSNLSDDLVYFNFGDGTTSDQPIFTHEYETDGLYKVSLIGVKESCVYEESVVLPFFYTKVPNVITPDGDGLNDTFKILYGDQLISSFNLHVQLQIYNRWGGLIYEDHDYRDNWSGESVDSGVYYYEVRIDKDISCKGWLQVIK